MLTGIKQNVSIGDKPYTLARFTLTRFFLWQEWACAFLPDPVPRIVRDFSLWPEDCQSLLADEAIDFVDSRRDCASPEMQALWMSKYGVITAVALLLNGNNELALAAYEEYGQDTLNTWIARASGQPFEQPWEVEERAYRQAGFLPPVIPRKPSPIDWGSLYKNLFTELGMTPSQVNELTLPELSSVCGVKPELSDTDKIERARLYHKLTPLQKLQIALN